MTSHVIQPKYKLELRKPFGPYNSGLICKYGIEFFFFLSSKVVCVTFILAYSRCERAQLGLILGVKTCETHA